MNSTEPTLFEASEASPERARGLSPSDEVIHFACIYLRVRDSSVLALPRRLESIRPESMRAIFSVGVPAAMSLLLFDLTNMVINRLSSAHGDLELAAIGIVLKVERLPLNIGICLGMVPLVAYNYSSGNFRRMQAFFSAARLAGTVISILCVVLYRIFAPQIIRAFIPNAETVRLGTQFLQARCFATPFMFLSFHMVHFLQAIGRGPDSFRLAAIRQLCLNIPLLFLLDHLFGMNGVVWTQMTADLLNVLVSYLLYSRIRTKAFPPSP